MATNSAPFDKDLAEALFGLEIPKQIRIQPNGRQVVYAASLQTGALRKGKQRTSTLWIASTSEAGSARKLTSGESNDVSPEWHPDGNQVAFLSDRGSPGGSFSIWTLRLDGGDAVRVSDSAAVSAFAYSPDGQTVAYTSADEKEEKDDEDPKVWGDDAHRHARLRLVHNGATTTLDTGAGHIVSFAWSHDSKSIAFGSVQNLDPEETHVTGATIFAVNVHSGAVSKVCTVSKYAADLTWAPDGMVYYINRAVLDSCWSGHAVYAVDPETQPATTEKIISGDDDEPSGLKLANGRVLVTREARTGTLITDVSGQCVLERNLVFSAYDAHLDTSTNTWTVAACLSDINTPPEVVVAQQGHAGITLSHHGKALKSRQFGSFRVLTCPSADGEVELDGIYLTPTGASTPLPTAVFIHGGPMARSHNQFDPHAFYWIPYLLAQGYGVLLPQYRGSTGRGSQFAGYTVTGHGAANYNDIISITDHAVRAGFADGTRLLVGGWSMGGIMTYLCSVRNGRHGLGWRFNAAIAGAGICDMDSATLESDVGSTAHAQMGGRAPWNSAEDDTRGRRGSALWQVAAAADEARRSGEMVIPPMLILHGEKDTRAPFVQSQGFRRALRAHGLPCEFVAYPGQGHTPAPMAHWMDMLQRVARYCHVYLKGDDGDGR